MAVIILMIVATVGIMTFFVKTGKAGKTSAAEIVLSRAWSNRFSRMDLEDKRLAYLKEYEKYRRDKEKKARKKVRDWDRQIENYRNQEEKYYSGSTFSFLDYICLFGYQMLIDLKLDGDNEVLKKLTASCEQSGFIELERNQETSGKRNSAIYAYFLLASLVAFMWIGLILACLMGTLMIAAGKEAGGILMPMVASFIVCALYGYLPYDGILIFRMQSQKLRFW